MSQVIGILVSMTNEGERFAALLDEVMKELRRREETGSWVRYRHLVEQQGPALLRDLVPEGWQAKGGAGKGKPAKVPWISAFAPGSPATPLEGYYLSFLFAADGSSVFLCLQQNAEGHPRRALLERARELRAATGPISGLIDQIDLRTTSALPMKYEAAAVASKRFAQAEFSWHSLRDPMRTVIAAIQRLRGKDYAVAPRRGPTPSGSNHPPSVSRTLPLTKEPYARPVVESEVIALASELIQSRSKISDLVRSAPRGPGLYAIFGTEEAWTTLGLDPGLAVVNANRVVEERSLYIGKHQKDARGRVLQHFGIKESGLAGHSDSTLRCSLIALLRDKKGWGLVQPRPPVDLDKPRIRDYRFIETRDEALLSDWMGSNLRVAHQTPDEQERLPELENALIRLWHPPLNIRRTDPVTPWRYLLESGRSFMAQEASRWQP